MHIVKIKKTRYDIGEELVTMRKPKIYLDTSVIGFLDQNKEPKMMNDTLKLWASI